MSLLVEDIDVVHEAIARFYKDDVTDPRCSIDEVFKDLLALKSKLYLRIELHITSVTSVMAAEGLKTRSRVKFSLSANTKKASGLIIHKANTVRVISNLDVTRLMELPWSQKNPIEKDGYLLGGHFQYQYKPK